MGTSWTQADLTKLERAIATGTLSVSYDDGRRVVYRSLEDMETIRRQIMGAVDPNSLGPRRKVAAHSKGIRGGALEPFQWWERP